MFHRQKVLLALIEEFGGSLKSTDLQKYLFLYTTICEKDKSYEFVPYKFGCCSLQSYKDKNKLMELGYLNEADDWVLKNKDKSFKAQLKVDTQNKMQLFRQKYEKLKGRKLIKYVYQNYPYYAVNSIIADEILDEDDLVKVKTCLKKRRKNVFATIGYEGITLEAYVNKLIKNDIRVLVDVRKNPLSRKYGFSKNTLKDVLYKVGIGYEHLPDLGIISSKRKKLVTQKDYEKLFNEYEKTVLGRNEMELDKLYGIYLDKKRIAVTCFEECHTMCHRGRVATHLKKINSEMEILHL